MSKPLAKPKSKKPTAKRKLASRQPATTATSTTNEATEPVRAVIPPAYRVFGGALRVLADNWKVFAGIAAIYGLLVLVLAQGFGGSGVVGEVKSALTQAGHADQLSLGTTLFVYLLGNGSATQGQVGSLYQFLLGVVASLACIWTLRQVYGQRRVRIRDGFYQGMYPLVPFLLVLGVVALQLVPLLIGAFLFGTVQANGVANGPWETALWGGLFFALAVASLYMLASSLFALYIVCLPDMPPRAALRAARQLVRRRRWTVLRKLLFLPAALLVLTAVVTIPLIMLATAVAVWVFFGLSIAGLVMAHSYMYRLYRELL